MVQIDIEMPEACCECPLNFWNRYRLLQTKTGGWIEHPSIKRLDNCPLIFEENHKQLMLGIVQDRIADVSGNFPRTHDDEVKLDLLHDLRLEINDMPE